VHLNSQKVKFSMTGETRSTAVALTPQNVRSWPQAIRQASSSAVGRVGAWAEDTAQQFGALLAALLAPAVLSAYAFVAWSLAANLGWTDSFVFKTGPLSNWMIWMGVAALVSLAASILRKRSRGEE
jgi:LPXTG-motif cell wall-anchored protein